MACRLLLAGYHCIALHSIAMIGTSDQSCWLAEAFQVLLLLLGWLL